MDDQTDRPGELCADLVSERRLEAGSTCLFRCKPAGGWVSVRELYEAAGTTADGAGLGLSAAWLPYPGGGDGYAVVLFFDAESQWSTTAVCNTVRLLAGTSRTG